MATGFVTKSRFMMAIIAAYAMIYLVWGSTYFFIDRALDSFSPFMLGAFRFTVAGLLLLGWCKMKGHDIFNWNLIKNSSVTGLLLLFIDTGIIIYVEQFLTSGLVAIMAASAAIWFIVLDKPNWGKNFRNIPVLAGLFLGFLGVVMLFGEQIAIATDADTKKANVYGMGLLILGAIAWTVGSLYSKYFNNSKGQENTNSMVGTGWQILISGIAFCIAALITGEADAFAFSNVSTDAWMSMFYLITFGSIVAYSSYIWLLKVRPATEVSTYAYINPIVAVVLGLLFAGESVSMVQLTGLMIILTSVFLINFDAYFKKDKSKTKALRRIRTKPKGIEGMLRRGSMEAGTTSFSETEENKVDNLS